MCFYYKVQLRVKSHKRCFEHQYYIEQHIYVFLKQVIKRLVDLLQSDHQTINISQSYVFDHFDGNRIAQQKIQYYYSHLSALEGPRKPSPNNKQTTRPYTMNNMFNDDDDEPCLHFMQDQSAQSNSLLGNIIIHKEPNDPDLPMFASNNLAGNYPDNLNNFSYRPDFDESSENICKKQEDLDSYQYPKSSNSVNGMFTGYQNRHAHTNKLSHQNKREGVKNQYDGASQEKSQKHNKKIQRPCTAKSKERKKIFYRDKMAELINQESYIKPQYNYVDFAAHNNQDRIPISRDQQLKRNRESAKQSRQRKKQYVQTLEDKNKQYKKMISDLTQRLREKQLELQRLKESSNRHLQSFIELRSANYEKLQTVINTGQNQDGAMGNQNENELISQMEKNKSPLAMTGSGLTDDLLTPTYLAGIQACLNEQRERFGSSGSERVRTINYYMEEIIENSIPDIHKYFINCALEKTGLFSQNATQSEVGQTRIQAEINSILGMTLEKRKVLIQKYRDTFNREAALFSSISKKLYQIFNSLISQSSILEKIFYDMSSHFNSYQIGSLFLYFEENKFRKDHKRVKNSWYQGFLKKQHQVVDEIRKMTKSYRYN